MPWCATWGIAASPLWWILPLIGLAFMALMVFVCFRCFTGRFGCMGAWRHEPGDSGGDPVAGSRSPTS